MTSLYKKYDCYSKLTRRFCVACLFIPLLQAAPAWSDSRGELLLFPLAEGIFRAGQDSSLEEEDNELSPGVDFFGTFEIGRLHFLGEYFLNEDESELERAQIGWWFEETHVWLGRYHAPIGLWGTQAHHGTYLQTSISRPALAEFEDDGGIFPVHATGVMIEGIHNLGDWGIGYDFAFGLGSGFEFEKGSLEPLNLLNPNEGEQGLTRTARLSYYPDPWESTQIGFFVNFSTFPGSNLSIKEIEQQTSGAYVDWTIDRWHFISEIYYSQTEIVQPFQKLSSSFTAGYLQAEYKLDSDWTLYGRIEGNSDDASNSFLALFPSHITERQLVGVNYKLNKNHRLKLEFSSVNSLQDRYKKIVLEWSAVLP